MRRCKGLISLAWSVKKRPPVRQSTWEKETRQSSWVKWVYPTCSLYSNSKSQLRAREEYKYRPSLLIVKFDYYSPPLFYQIRLIQGKEAISKLGIKCDLIYFGYDKNHKVLWIFLSKNHTFYYSEINYLSIFD